MFESIVHELDPRSGRWWRLRACASVTRARVRIAVTARSWRRAGPPGLRGGRQRRSRRARAGSGAPPGEGRVSAGRSRSRCARAGNGERDGDRLGQRVRNVLEPEDTEPDGAFKAGRLRLLAASRASSEVRPRGGSEPQPAAWAAKVGHERGHIPFLPGKPWPHTGQTRLITECSDRSSSSSKYTRCRPRPDTRRTCPHSGQL